MRRLLATGLLLTACSSTLDGVGNVHDLRMLAMRATPPEVLIAPDAGLVTVTALIANPPKDVQVSCTWTTCAAPESETARCEPDSPGFKVLGSSTETTGPNGAEPSITFRPDPALLQLLTQTDPFKGVLGLRQQVQLEIRAGDESVVGYKRVVYTAFTGTPVVLNQNPVVGPLEFNDAGWPADRVVDFAVAPPRMPGQMNFMPAAVRNQLTVLEDRSLRETYVVRTFEGATRTLEETWRYNFFASNGAFSPASVGGANLINPDAGIVTSWAPVDGEDGGSGPTTVWIVVRDGRGGETWAVRHATAP